MITFPTSPQNNSIIKIPTRLSAKAMFSFKYFSALNETDVHVYRVVDGVKQVKQSGEVILSDDVVILHVLSHNITTQGTKADVSIQINTTNDLTQYAIVVSNSVGEKALTVDVVLKGISFLFVELVYAVKITF